LEFLVDFASSPQSIEPAHSHLTPQSAGQVKLLRTCAPSFSLLQSGSCGLWRSTHKNARTFRYLTLPMPHSPARVSADGAVPDTAIPAALAEPLSRSVAVSAISRSHGSDQAPRP